MQTLALFKIISAIIWLWFLYWCFWHYHRTLIQRKSWQLHSYESMILTDVAQEGNLGKNKCQEQSIRSGYLSAGA